MKDVRRSDTRRKRRPKQLRSGLTRTEWVALALMAAVLVALALPFLQQSRQAARRNTCEFRLTDLGMTTLFVTELRPRKEFPGYVNEQAVDAAGKRAKIGWEFELLPYLARPSDVDRDAVPLGEIFDPLKVLPGPETFGPRKEIHSRFGPEGSQDTRGKTPDLYLPEFMCPDDPRSQAAKRLPWTSYVANCGLPDAKASDKYPADWPANGVFLERFENHDADVATSPQFVEDHDGTSFTMMLSENLDAGLWTDGEESRVGFCWSLGDSEGRHTADSAVLLINQERGKGDGNIRYARPSSNHGGGVLVMYCDGSTKFMDEQLEFRIYCAQMTPDGPSARQPGSDELLESPYREVRKAP